MECIEARALKSSLLSEMGMKSNQQVLFDDVWCVNGINGVSADDFSVDVFLDFSDKDFKDMCVEESEEEEKDSLSTSSQDRPDDDNCNSNIFSGSRSGSGSLPAGELAFPVDDLKDLEWLSQFVDDSASEFSLLCPTGNFKERTGKFTGKRCPPVTRPEVLRTPPSRCFAASTVPSKARSKRSRPAGRVWSLRSPSLSESSSSSLVSSLSYSTPCLIFANPVQVVEVFESLGEPAVKKPKRKPAPEAGVSSQTQRRCSHCQVQKTPQWRTGPLGPKTLCNACGVRFKSGRLFPEYRPACSPTFSGEIHSNSHRKVLEMRRKKDTTGTESGSDLTVQSY